MEFANFKQLFNGICEIKKTVVKLKSKELEAYKRAFFRMQFNEWQLSLLWEFIMNDKSYNEIYDIFKSKKLI